MQTTEKQLLSLIRAGLWQTPADPSLFQGEVNWPEIIRLSRMQTVKGIAYDGMLTLPAVLRPPRPLLLQWTSSMLQLEARNQQLNESLWKLFATYEVNGVTAILMKGQGLAQNYPDPLHRQCGDIDVYVTPKGFKEANRLLVALGGEIVNVSSRRALCKWGEITIENHCRITEFGSPFATRFLKREMKKVPASNRRTQVGDYGVRLLPLELDVMFVLVHLVLHYVYEGVGLRQLCDWARMLHCFRDEIDPQELERLLRGVGCFKGARIVAALAVTHLGLPQSDVPFQLSDEDYQNSKWLLADILECGNFGFYSQSYAHRPKKTLQRWLYTFRKMLRRGRKNYALAPAEAIFYPFRLFVTVIRIRINRLFGKENVE